MTESQKEVEKLIKKIALRDLQIWAYSNLGGSYLRDFIATVDKFAKTIEVGKEEK